MQVLAVGNRSTSRAPKIANGDALLATWDAGWPRVVVMLGIRIMHVATPCFPKTKLSNSRLAIQKWPI